MLHHLNPFLGVIVILIESLVRFWQFLPVLTSSPHYKSLELGYCLLDVWENCFVALVLKFLHLLLRQLDIALHFHVFLYGFFLGEKCLESGRLELLLDLVEWS